ncbi:MAG: hypothetical protein ACYCV7_11495 [Acidimicrobiales bacterium]
MTGVKGELTGIHLTPGVIAELAHKHDDAAHGLATAPRPAIGCG